MKWKHLQPQPDIIICAHKLDFLCNYMLFFFYYHISVANCMWKKIITIMTTHWIVDQSITRIYRVLWHLGVHKCFLHRTPHQRWSKWLMRLWVVSRCFRYKHTSNKIKTIYYQKLVIYKLFLFFFQLKIMANYRYSIPPVCGNKFFKVNWTCNTEWTFGCERLIENGRAGLFITSLVLYYILSGFTWIIERLYERRMIYIAGIPI